MPHDHHDHLSPSGHPYRPDDDVPLTYWQTMEIAVREILVEKGTGRIVGAHLVGHHGEELIHLFALAMRHGITLDQLGDELSQRFQSTGRSPNADQAAHGRAVGTLEVAERAFERDQPIDAQLDRRGQSFSFVPEWRTNLGVQLMLPVESTVPEWLRGVASARPRAAA